MQINRKDVHVNMRIQPLEQEMARRRAKNLTATIYAAVMIIVVIAGIGGLIHLIASICKDAYESKYEYQIELLESQNEELFKRIDELKSQLSTKDMVIEDLQDTVNRTIKEKSEVQNEAIIEEPAPFAATPVDYTEKIEWDLSNNSVTNITGASADQLNALIDQILETRFGTISESHPLSNMGEELSRIENENGVSATFILSIVTWESGFCDYDNWPDSYKWSNNCAGIMKGNNPRYFENINECILYLGQLLREVYIDKHDLEYANDIGIMYCETPQWGEKIESTMLDYNSQLYDIINLEETQ